MTRFIWPAVFVMCGTMAFAQNNSLPRHIVPAAVEQKFALENPEATADWKKDGDLYKAIFINPINNLGYILVYNKKGTVVRREKELERPEYPPSIIAYHDRYYPGEGLAVYSSTDSLGNTLYYSQKNNKVFWFDTQGRPVKVINDTLPPAASR